MTDKATLSRRTLLQGSAITAGAVMLGACSPGTTNSSGDKKGSKGDSKADASKKGSATKPLPKPAKLTESPLLAEQVKAGKLDALEKRIPGNPYVVPHKWLEEGKYGGTLQMIVDTSDNGNVKELMYGHSPLRWLNDGLSIGPGLAESWESNADATEWTFHFRKGLRWSDGEPWSTDDIMFWWNDIVLNEDHTDVPPDEAKSGKGTTATFKAVDETTLSITFDAPAPLTADRLAMWTNGTIGNGPKWMAPAHFAKQYHVKYNPKAGKDWAKEGGVFEKNVDFSQNPKCPTMNGWMLKSYQEGRSVVYERNPYYYAVSPEGKQLPYLDTINYSIVKDFQVGKLQVQKGEIDYVHGPFYNIDLPDISPLRKVADSAGIDLYTWDGGSGTGSLFFFNYDHKDPKLRELIRKPEFRQAISYAFNREQVRKALYYNTGEPTTGTLSPKAKEYLVNDEGKQVYKDWRDAYIKYDPAKAKQLLDGLGLKDTNGDGFREYPDGSKLSFTLDFPADTTDEHKEKMAYLKRDLDAVGLKTVQNPFSPDTWGEQWEQGRLTSHNAWEVGDGPNHLVYPQWLVPIEASRYCPLEGKYYDVIRSDPKKVAEMKKISDPWKRTPPNMEPEAGGPVEALWKLYDQSKIEPDEMKRHKLVWDMIKIHIDSGPFFMGSVANTPRVIVKKTDLKNVPDKPNLQLGGFANPWIHPTPAVYDPEAFFWEDPTKHA
ncbi:ABC transporter substrate-binding protein [Flindersiella endophytica]